YAEAYCGLGNVLQLQCRIEEAIAAYRRALELRPDYPTAISNLLMTQCYDPRPSPQERAAEHRRLGSMLEAGVRAMPARWTGRRDMDPERCLRVGYVSADFRLHSCAYFIEPLLAAHDPGRVETFCYSASARGDEVTDRLQRLARHWQVVAAS